LSVRPTRLSVRGVLFVGTVITALLILNSCSDYRSEEKCSDAISRGDKGRFEVTNAGLARDSDTGTVWYRCAAGQRYSNFRCKGDILLLTWDEAIDYAEEFSEKSGVTWRLPTDDEMISVTESSCVNPAINYNVFPDISVNNHWTSSKGLHQDVFRCAVNSYNGRMSCRQARKIAQPFLLVRDGG
jgi:hypothetical protein